MLQNRVWLGFLLLCSVVFGLQQHASAQQVQVKPWFLVIVDTSGSMYSDSGGNACTNGATNQPTCTCVGCSNTNSCGWPRTRISDAKCALRNILNSTGDAQFALMQFKHACRADCSSASGAGTFATDCDGQMLQVLSGSNYDLLQWVDNTCQGSCANGGYTTELYAHGYTPISQSLATAKSYFTGATSPTATDDYVGCRPVSVILLTDGDSNCASAGSPGNSLDPTPNATALRTSVVPIKGNSTKSIDIKTYAIGFGKAAGDAQIEALATAGGTDAPGSFKGFYAQDEESLSSALNQIIVNSQLQEICDGRDNDCDGRYDEDNPKYCDVNGIRTINPKVLNAAGVLVDQATVHTNPDATKWIPACAGGVCPKVSGTPRNTNCAAPEWALSSSVACTPPNLLCSSPGEICNGSDDDCDGKTDEGAPAIASTNEACGNGTDDDCDGKIDEGCNGCIAQPEVCDNVNNDCDSATDENLSRACGSNVGECTVGTETCSAGNWINCTGKGPVAETCNNKDDDCDGVTDGQTQTCGTSNVGLCRLGVSTCTAGKFGSCVGNVDPTAELCDGLDNNCVNGLTDDGTGDSRIAKTCGSNTGVCKPGTTACVAGDVKCQGGTQASPEICDGLDNDCDGNVDEGVAATDPNIGKVCIAPGGVVMYGPVMVQGACKTGTTVCSMGKIVCPGYVGPSAELCDAIDSDCDGNPSNGVAQTDPRVGANCGTSIGECDPGHLQCINNMLTCDALPPGVESCNSKDDDCDGLTDEDLPAVPTSCDSSNPAHGNIGLCKVGQSLCIGGKFVCQGEVTPTPELCDGFDNNCNNQTDEGNPGGGKVCGSNIGVCKTGTTLCSMGKISCQGDTKPTTEICDGLDNDCDGVTDEGNPGGGADCSYDDKGVDIIGACRTSTDPTKPALPKNQACGECRFGTEVCDMGKIICRGVVGMKPEICDGLDNDCDSPCVVDTTDPAHPKTTCPDDPCALPKNDPKYLDCLGNIDEGLDGSIMPPSDPNVGVACSGGNGECKQGIEACKSGILVCVGGQMPDKETCNNKDDDCDTQIDEDFPVGGPCGTDLGECHAGTYACDTGTGGIKCVGATMPGVEQCDNLDNDCDGKTDEGNPDGGKACGSSTGVCSPGMEQCVGGKLACVGGMPATTEVCDCLDNNCNGMTDEDPNGTLCPGGSTCMNCQCAPPCNNQDEFGMKCARGRSPVINDKTGACFCEAEKCNDIECAKSTLKSGDDVVCAPNDPLVGNCACKSNACVARCNGVQCPTAGLVCDPTDGTCKEPSCALPQFGCGDGKYCDIVKNDCATDPCAKTKCDADQACRAGKCLDSCALVSCKSGEQCVDGACLVNKCAKANCGNQVCDPTNGKCVNAGTCATTGCSNGFICNGVSGQCVADPCLATTCPTAQVCKSGQCELLCKAPLVDCGGVCIDPREDNAHCGATTDCTADNAGKACGSDQVCSDGECSTGCKEGRLACNGGCINPKADETYCGASGDCTGLNKGRACIDGFTCQSGECQPPSTPGKNDNGEAEQRVAATGGGGCACTVPSSAPARGMPWLLSLIMVGIVMSRRRMRGLVQLPLAHGRVLGGARITRAARTAGMLIVLVVVSSVLTGLAGCKVDTFCVNCTEKGHSGATDTDGGAYGNSDGAITQVMDYDGGKGTAGSGNAGKGGSNGGGGNSGSNAGAGGSGVVCIDHELCNGIDDDCNGKIDDGADPVAEGIDLQTDLNNCGKCGNVCAPDHAFGKCVKGACEVRQCDVEYTDFDKDPKNGCEFMCTPQATDDKICDQRDNDCDMKNDEDVPLQTDTNNCGSCGHVCDPAHAASGGECKAGACTLDPQKCDDGFVDADHNADNGCEYKCTPKNGGVEQCNKLDDDCDHSIDEDVATSDPAIGKSCGTDTGECTASTTTCVNGRAICQSKDATLEICDNKDNNCDGNTDESFPQMGLPCGNDLGQCVRGNQQCSSGVLVCMGGVLPATEICDGLDNDCDGLTDETNATDGAPTGVGSPCVTLAGGALDLSPAAVKGACRQGVAQCTSGHLVCAGEVGPKAELCDAIDQDCDGNPTNGVATTDTSINVPCGTDLGECTLGTMVCTGTSKVCQGGKTPNVELCNGKDDDCDGKFDENGTGEEAIAGVGEPCLITAAGVVQHGATLTTKGLCTLGTSVCSGGVIACPDYVGPIPELCDNKDQDCDGNNTNSVSSTDPALGQICAGNNNTGACKAGTTVCTGTSVSCTGQVGPSTELCDGIDNDCDADPTDDGSAEPTLNQICGANVGACKQGAIKCTSGALQCAGQTIAVTEVCDSIPGDPTNPKYDNDCDGKVDEDFQLQTNVNRCGSCSNVCNITNATPKCVAGACQIAACKPNYYDDTTKAGADCLVGPCTLNGAEICNGKDDDCDGKVDETLTAPTNACNTVGACLGSTVSCGGGSGWVCSKNPAPQESCNGIDDNCDGRIDEGFNVKATCAATGVGACATPGTLACLANGTGTQCVDKNGVLVVAGTPGAVTETCNGKDDDCDGKTDEPCGGADNNCVTDAWVTTTGGTSIYKYEASRPDADDKSSGANTTRACSALNRLPWTNVTYLQAQAACKAADTNGRLCDESEWEEACVTAPLLGSCTWGFPDGSCNAFTNTQCNGFDNNMPSAAQLTGHSGGGAGGACYRGPVNTAASDIFELSGNVKEYVLQRASGGIPVRGGAWNNTSDGLRCDFDFPLWPNNSPFTNVGFRCCKNTTALDPVCGTFTSTSSVTDTTLVTDTITVPLLGPITDVNIVSLTGTISRVNELDYAELVGPDGTTTRLFNTNCTNNNNANWSFSFDSASGNGVPPANNCTAWAGANTYAPFATLNAYNNKEASGTWTIRIHDRSPASRNPTLTGWGVRVCVNQN